MKLATDPAKAPTIWHYTPFLISTLSVVLSLVAVGLNLWVWWSA